MTTGTRDLSKIKGGQRFQVIYILDPVLLAHRSAKNGVIPAEPYLLAQPDDEGEVVQPPEGIYMATSNPTPANEVTDGELQATDERGRKWTFQATGEVRLLPKTSLEGKKALRTSKRSIGYAKTKDLATIKTGERFTVHHEVDMVNARRGVIAQTEDIHVNAPEGTYTATSNVTPEGQKYGGRLQATDSKGVLWTFHATGIVLLP